VDRFAGPVAFVLLSSVLCPPSPAQADPPRPTPDELVRGLGDPSYRAREAAAAELWRRGREAVPALRKALLDPSPEVARRAAGVLDRFDWYLYPDTPADVAAGVTRFLNTGGKDRNDAFADLLRLGPRGRAAGRAILDRDLPPAVRDPLAAFAVAHLRREVPARVVAGDADTAADLIALHVTRSGTPAGAADYAAFHVLRGTLPAAVGAAEAAPKSAAADLILAHLYRANRDWAKARAVAARVDAADAPRRAALPVPGPTLVEGLIEEQGDWAAARALPPVAKVNMPEALRLTYLRLTGDRAAFDAAAKQVADIGDGPVADEFVRSAAYALLANHRAADAAALLESRGQAPGLLADLYIARLRYGAALTVDAAVETPAARYETDIRRARVLALTGNRDGAAKLFRGVAAALRRPPTVVNGRELYDMATARRSLVRAELRSGLRELACEHTGEFVADQQNGGFVDGRNESNLDVLFGNDADAAERLFAALRFKGVAGDQPGAVMVRVRELFLGTAPPGAAAAALAALADPGVADQQEHNPFGLQSARQLRRTRLLAAALVARAAGKHPEAEAAFAAAAAEAADEPVPTGARAWVYGTSDAHRPWVEYGDYLYDRGRFADAAARYHEGWTKFPDVPLLLYLSGRALAKAGDAAEGKRRAELAHWVPLGNERARGKFLEELVRRGEAKAAARETDLVLRACWGRDGYYGNVVNQAGRAAALNKDWDTAERCIQRSLLVMMKTPGVAYVDPTAYVTVPHEMLLFRARGRLAAGDVPGAMAAARAFLDVTPGAVELPVGMVPELEKLGQKAEADELFARVWAAHKKVLADYPASAFARNSLATLAAGCRRELDAALTYATEAVAADPKSPGFREVLAEVRFRRGERAEAVAAMEALAAEYPRSRAYRRQLARYKTADPAAPPADTEDD
jgi:tetratricopeptide (TPR) repeat protein